MTIDVNLSTTEIASASTRTHNGTAEYQPFLAVSIVTEDGGSVGVLLKDSRQALKLAEALTRGAYELEKIEAAWKAKPLTQAPAPTPGFAPLTDKDIPF
jgi:hypothetical protein